MLSIWKLRVGAEDYYLAQVADGLDDYYSGHGEAPGVWCGFGSIGLGLAGDVSGDDLKAILAGLAPGTGLTPNASLLTHYRRRVPGFDLTFSAPKSVSILYALGDPGVQGLVVDAVDKAVDDAVGFLEREACFVRRGSNNRTAHLPPGGFGTRRMMADGFVAARFRHRTSRAGDPQLHCHVLVANLAQGVDGRWSALDGRAIYTSARAASDVFQAALRDGLTRRLGVEWGPIRDGKAEVGGVPEHVRRLFSKRREVIEAVMAEYGLDSRAASDRVALGTRGRKVDVDSAALDADWKAEATAAGWGPTELEELLAGLIPFDPSPLVGERWRLRVTETVDGDDAVRDRILEPDTWIRDCAVPALTVRDAVFDRHAVTRLVTGALGEGAPAALVEQLTERVLACDELVPVAVPGPRRVQLADRTVADRSALRWTTRAHLAVEARFTNVVAAGRGAVDPPVAEADIDAAVGRAVTLGADQEAAVRRLASSRNRVDVMVGPAGTGKTFTLDAVRDCYRRAGWQVIGVAPSARAALELEAGARIPSRTIASFLRQSGPLAAHTLVVVDEAGMAATVDLAAVVDHVERAGGRVVLVGDHRQLPEVRAGGAFAHALNLLAGDVAELSVNRRQQAEWELAALDDLRAGDVAAAFDKYLAHDRVRCYATRADMRAALVADWWTHTQTGADVLVLAGTRAEADSLNRAARARWAAAGRLTGPAVEVSDGCELRVGDRVVLLRNSTDNTTPDGAATYVANGLLAAVEQVHVDAGEVTVRIRDDGRLVRLDAGYLAAHHVDWGYAVTVHKGQGVTCDVTLTAGVDGLYREAGYVAQSRGRTANWIYATTAHVDLLAEAAHHRGLPLPGDTDDDTDTVAEAAAELLERLARSGAKTMASVTDPAAPVAARLAGRPLADLEAELAWVEQVERHGPDDPTLAARALARARDCRTHLTVGRRVGALDRDNVGTVTALDDTVGTALVEFVSDHGHAAHRRLDWADLVVIDHPDPVPLTVDATATLTRRARHVDTLDTAWAAYLTAFGLTPRRRQHLARAVAVRRQRAAHHLAATRPDWLHHWIGARPPDPVGARVWDDVVARVAVWRDRHSLPADVPGLGSRPDDGHLAAVWERAMIELWDDRRWLTSRPPITPRRVERRSIGELAARRRELDILMHSAPPDQRRLIDELTTGSRHVDDLAAALAEANAGQDARRRWIVDHWPYVVELAEITRILDTHPTSVPAVVRALLDVWQTRLGPPAREDRSLADLEAERDAPTRHLRALTDRADQLRRDLELLDPASTTLDQDRHVLTAALHLAEADADAARPAHRQAAVFHRVGIHPLDAAIADREAALLYDAIVGEPDWVIDLLSRLTRGIDEVTRVDAHHVRDTLVEIARHRDRYTITGPEPLGPPPAQPGAHPAAHGALEAAIASDHAARVARRTIIHRPDFLELDGPAR